MKEISEETKLMLLGLKTLADSYSNKLDEIYTTAKRILETEDDRGLVCDFVYDPSVSLETFLERLEKWS